jgi:methionine salvage enolase-phosphatase E1
MLTALTDIRWTMGKVHKVNEYVLRYRQNRVEEYVLRYRQNRVEEYVLRYRQNRVEECRSFLLA